MSENYRLNLYQTLSILESERDITTFQERLEKFCQCWKDKTPVFIKYFQEYYAHRPGMPLFTLLVTTCRHTLTQPSGLAISTEDTRTRTAIITTCIYFVCLHFQQRSGLFVTGTLHMLTQIRTCILKGNIQYMHLQYIE